MGISIHYRAERERPVEGGEQARIDEIIRTYEAERDSGDGEDFCVYDHDPDEPEAIFYGSTKLPMSEDPWATIAACLHWAKCLTDIRRVLPDAAWEVHMDDTCLEWDEENGWHLPGMEAGN
jgi:hypothetical protein